MLGVWLTIALMVALPLGGAPIAAAQYLGLFHTQDEVAVWKERAVSGPYRVAGDVQPNSPGDWTRLLANADAFVANPSVDRYLGTGGTCPTETAEGPFGGNQWTRGVKLRDAAFVSVVLGATNYRDAVLGELLVHAAAPGLDWTNDTLFGCSTFEGHVTLPWNSLMVKYIIAYDMIRASISAPNRTTLDTWFLNYGNRMEQKVHGIAAKRVPKRKSDDYTVAAGYATCPTSGGDFAEARTLYVGSVYTTCNFHAGWHNPSLFGTLGFGLVGIVLNNTPLKTEAKRFFQEHIQFNQWPDGTQGETFRWHPNTPLSGMSYPGTVINMLALLADAFARIGDNSLYDYTTTNGYLTSQVTNEGTTKSLRHTINEYLARVRGTRSIYAESVTENTKLDADMEACCGWSTNNDVIVAALTSRYYQDPALAAAYRRTSGGPPYSTSLNTNCGGGAGASAAWMTGDAFCVLPGVLFQFAQLEGKVNPYPTPPPGPQPPLGSPYVVQVTCPGTTEPVIVQVPACPVLASPPPSR